MIDIAHQNRIDRVVDHIQANLESGLTVKGLSEIACLSEFHFSRIFKVRMEETVYRFIRRLRLEKAAEMLISRPGLTITDVAMVCGFATPSAFAKSFKDHFGVTASQWRHQYREDIKRSSAQHSSDLVRLFFSGNLPVWTFECAGEKRKITLEHMPRLKVGYVRYVGPFQENDLLFDNLYHRLFQWAIPRGFLTGDPVRFNIFHDNPDITHGKQLRVMAAIPVPVSVGDTDMVGLFTLSGGPYAVCRRQLQKGEFIGAWQWMYTAWLADSGYVQDSAREMLERYFGEKIVNGQRVYDVDICIPVRAK